ncbi:adenosylcobinamide-phosphate synthase CbiB [Halalkalicoccus jeotgali]|uniref:Probable cobalamin biosynthesis protein CobD n=1 Tax=Halalkalicoccus jeotgali (strain DSM 18796 / CECT 7217 / JCM 14584 / KCTC 4019 / B3) TaxID=795797 RepID=D8J6Y4_HALJB|nr:adenosylcobinamide-phosphate synthase CbiB [Halalkalicoccus jeotgali]ADJ15937.1 cobalamin biosynthesis protein CobD [Halalkalicoccus jeotgali B3]ELY38033.1 cobalamin biosynthesis protein CobD [Halalkalicoccus jeotgali B3]
MSDALVALALAVGLELAMGEPPTTAHPVAWFGRLVGRADRAWSRPRTAGLAVAIALPVLAAGVVVGAVALAGGVHHLVGALAAGTLLFVSTSLRMLLDVARTVIAESEHDPVRARESVRALAGRDATDLSAGEIRSAAVESAAENLADGLVAPLGAFAVLAPVSLSLAAGAATWVKAVNTLDSMLGYPEKPHGTASARLDDAVMWLPARASALLLALVSGRPYALVRAAEWARAPPSPNSGWPMATLSSVLDVRLEKPGVYVLNSSRGLPTVAEARRGVRTVALAGALAYLLAGVFAWS